MMLGLVLLVAVGLHWRFNQLGQNVLNLLAAGVLMVGLDKIVVAYSCLTEKSQYEGYFTFFIFCIFVLARLFEAFNATPQNYMFLNNFCYYFVFTILGANFLCYLAMFLIVAGYFVRYLYRLLSDTLLANDQPFGPEQIETLMQQRKEYRLVEEERENVGTMCPICYEEFEGRSICINLIYCGHIFHDDCLEKWIESKVTCPVCRSNLYLDIL